MKEKIKSIDIMLKKEIKDVLNYVGVKRVSNKELIKRFAEEAREKNLVPLHHLEFLYYLDHVKEDYKKGLVTQEDVKRLEKDAHEFVEAIANAIKSYELKGTDKFKIKCKYDDKIGEVWFLGKTAYVIKDITSPTVVFKARLKKDGSIGELRKSMLDELDKKRKKIKVKKVATVKETTLESLKKIFGKDVEIIISE